MARLRLPSRLKRSLLSVGSSTFELSPAESRSHYDDPTHGGGTPYCYDSLGSYSEAWIVRSRVDRRVLGLVQKWGDGEFSYSAFVRTAPASVAMRDGGAPGNVFELSSRLHMGPDPIAAIAAGLGVSP